MCYVLRGSSVYSQCIRITEVMRTLIILASLVSLCWARTLLVETEGSEGTASLEAEGSESESDGTEWFIPPAPFYFKNGIIEGYGKKTGGPSNKSLFRFTPAERRRLRKPSSQLTRAERRDKRRLKRAQRGRG